MKPEPPEVIEALRTISAYLYRQGWAQCIIYPSGGTTWHQDEIPVRQLVAWATKYGTRLVNDAEDSHAD